MSTKLELIESNKYLGTLSDEAVEVLANAAQVQTFAAGDRLITKRSPGNHIWLIIEGNIEGGIALANVNHDAGSQIVGPGEFVGLLHFVDPSASTLTLAATSDLKTLVWDVAAWRDLCEKYPRDGYCIAIGLVRTLLKRMKRWNVGILDDLAWRFEQPVPQDATRRGEEA